MNLPSPAYTIKNEKMQAVEQEQQQWSPPSKMVTVRPIENMQVQAIELHSNREIWFSLKTDSTYSAIPVAESYQIYDGLRITQPISKNSFHEVAAQYPYWAFPLFMGFIAFFVVAPFVLPDLLKKFRGFKND